MALGKWIGGILGFMSAGPLGALAGIVLGGLFDNMLDAVNTPDSQQAFDYGTSTQHTNSGQRSSFLFSMLVLASYIIKADGKVMHSEMETVRQMLRQNFGETARMQGDEILRRLLPADSPQYGLFPAPTVAQLPGYHLQGRRACRRLGGDVDEGVCPVDVDECRRGRLYAWYGQGRFSVGLSSFGCVARCF